MRAAIKTKAIENEAKDYYMAGNEGLEGMYRCVTISDLDCWLGYIYFKNDTELALKQTVTLNLAGMEMFKKPNAP